MDKLIHAAKRLPHPGKVFVSWVVSYCIVLLLPMFLELAVYLSASHSMKQESQTAHYTALGYLSSSFEKEFEVISDFASKVASDPYFLYFLNAESIGQYSRDYASSSKASLLSSSLKDYEPVSGLMEDYYLFSLTNHLIWHNNGIFDLDGTVSSSSEHRFASRIFEEIQGEAVASIRILAIDSGLARQQTVILMPMPSNRRPQGYLAVLVDSSFVDSLIGQIADSYHSCFYLMLQDQEILYQSAYAKASIDLTAILDHGTPVFSSDMDSWIYRIDSAVFPVSYVAAAPSSPDDTGLHYLRLALFISMFCCILAGGFLIVYFARRNYSPVQDMVETIRQNSTDYLEDNKNEYQFVADALKDIYARHASVEEVVKRQNQTIYSYYLANLMKGRLPIWNTDEAILESIQEELSLDRYILLLTMFDFSSSFPAEHGEILDTAYEAFADTEFVSALARNLGTSYQVTGVQIYDFTACLISLPSDLPTGETKDNPAWQSDLRNALKPLSEHFLKCYHCKNFYAFSNVHEDISSVSDAYQEAADQMSYAITNVEANEIVFRKDLPDGHLKADLYAEPYIFNFVKSGDFDHLKEYLLQCLQTAADKMLSFHTIKGLSCGMLCTVIKAVLSFHSSPDSDVEKELYHGLSLLVRENSYEHLKIRLLEYAKLSCEFCAKQQETEKQSELISRIEAELNQNLYNENLNIMYLSLQLGVSAKILSSAWQEARGTNLTETIHCRRIERFKELVSNEGYSVKDAAKEVGYSSLVTLNRWFKKFEGVTPGKAKSSKGV